MKNNINEMKIEEAYQIHGEEVNRLTEKKMMYEQSQVEEFDEVLKKINITQSDYKELIFGPPITDDMLKKMPLGKLKRDLMNELGQFTRNYTQTTKRGLLTTNKG